MWESLFLNVPGGETSGNKVVDIATRARALLKELEHEARLFTETIKSEEWLHDKWETIAQSIIAMRHIEDARMRYGKVIQYATTWDSCYDESD